MPSRTCRNTSTSGSRGGADGTNTSIAENVTINITENLAQCTTLLTPINGEIDVAVDTDLSWNAISNADGYLIRVGTTSGGNDIEDNTDLGNVTTYDFSSDLPQNTIIYVTVTPYNSIGNSTACIEEIFRTEVMKNTTKFGFSPDGDGVNEFWKIQGIEDYSNNVVSIFNRWGDLVFKIKSYDNDQNVFIGDANRGINLGAGELPEGTYFFKIDIPEKNNLNLSQGFVIIKR